MIGSFFEHRSKNKALLDNGQIVEYDLCHDKPVSYYVNPDKYEFLGKGIIYEVNGYKQTGSEKYLFWNRLK
jgi:hypothetical protein